MKSELVDQISKCNAFIKKLRAGAKELNNKADEIAKLKTDLKARLHLDGDASD